MICLIPCYFSQGEGLKDSAASMPYYTGSIIPQPQKVKYYDEFIDLENTFIVRGQGVAENDARLKLLMDRIKLLNGKVISGENLPESGYSAVICMGACAETAALMRGHKIPDKEEGYVIYVTEHADMPVIVLKGIDDRGLLWAVSSLVQLTLNKDNKAMARKVNVYDYPVAVRRGFIYSTPILELGRLAATFKFNTVVLTADSDVGAANWRSPLPESWKDEIKECFAPLNRLGIVWYAGIRPVDSSPKISAASKDDFNALVRYCDFIASLGGNVMVKYDDHRFPLNPAEKQKFGSAKNADLYLIKELASVMEKKYPEFRILFCPPFYWGPKSEPDYGEPRSEYLAAMGTLPENVDIFWTGTHVRSANIKPEDVKWIKDLIKRKPWFWQNTPGIKHPLNAHYLAEPAPWKDWHYNEFINDIAIYALYSNDNLYIAPMVSMGDYSWNPVEHDQKESNKDAVMKLCGVDAYPYLVELAKYLRYFDQYDFMVNSAAAKNIVQITAMVEKMQKVYAEALKCHHDSISKWTALSEIVDRPYKFMLKIKDKPDLTRYIEQIDEVTECAEKETTLDIDNDVLLTPYDLVGGGGPARLGKPEKRFATWLYGQKSRFNSMSSRFTVPGIPTSDWQLIISGKTGTNGKKCKIKITINDKVVFNSYGPFVGDGWSQHTFIIKQGYFLNDDNNVLKIYNLENTGDARGEPVFILNYAVMKPTS
jgi:hypothetical protein